MLMPSSCSSGAEVSKLEVFNIKGKKYRLVVQINYAAEVIKIRWFGTHDAYNKINAEVI